MTMPLTREEIETHAERHGQPLGVERVLALLDENAALRRERDEANAMVNAQAARIVEVERKAQRDADVAAGLLATALNERDAYKRAKAENDERFMRERDDARLYALRLEASVQVAQATWDAGMAAAQAAAEKAGAERDALREVLAALDPQCITSPPCGSCVGCDARAALARTAEAARERDARLVAEARAQALEEAATLVDRSRAVRLYDAALPDAVRALAGKMTT